MTQYGRNSNSSSDNSIIVCRVNIGKTVKWYTDLHIDIKPFYFEWFTLPVHLWIIFALKNQHGITSRLWVIKDMLIVLCCVNVRKYVEKISWKLVKQDSVFGSYNQSLIFIGIIFCISLRWYKLICNIVFACWSNVFSISEEYLNWLYIIPINIILHPTCRLSFWHLGTGIWQLSNITEAVGTNILVIWRSNIRKL